MNTGHNFNISQHLTTGKRVGSLREVLQGKNKVYRGDTAGKGKKEITLLPHPTSHNATQKKPPTLGIISWTETRMDFAFHILACLEIASRTSFCLI